MSPYALRRLAASVTLLTALAGTAAAVVPSGSPAHAQRTAVVTADGGSTPAPTGAPTPAPTPGNTQWD
ncbi:hypothetical protein ABZ832_08635 [Streptantibioticus parmotrematis]|uniref:hypothetical protein n=1 Tax=Streptantibioticus parmotrematis TaxID=2873249 RepID=UPI003403A6B6